MHLNICPFIYLLICLIYRLLLSVTGLTDAYTKADESAQKNSATNESLKNTYTPSTLKREDQCPGKRIDYIFYSGGSRVKVDVVKYSLPLPDQVPECNYSYSDHEAVSSVLLISSNEKVDTKFDSQSHETVLNEAMVVCDDALRKCVNHKRAYGYISGLLFMILCVAIATDAPYGFNVLYQISKVTLTVFLIFTLIMATLWNKIERNAVLAGRLAMEVSLKRTIFK